MKLPKLYHLGKNGKLHSWEIWTEGNTIFSSAGTEEGKKILSSKIATPKNEGKINATTASEQADKEALAMHKFKLQRKYSLTPDEAKTEAVAPMLAQDFHKRKKKDVSYPGYVQPKLDGCRALAYWEDGKIVLTSRGNKEWMFAQHINKALEKILSQESVLDGELYVHGVPFQTLMSWMKREQPDNLKIEYHVYDIPLVNGLDLPWEERLEKLQEFFKEHPETQNIKLVPSTKISSEEEVLSFEQSVVENGYEGAMFRSINGMYNFGYRSYDLLKVKSFDDAEFEVIGFTEGIGKFAGCVIWICKTQEDKEFKVVPKATEAEKKRLFKEAKNYVGQMLTVNYFGVSEENVPRFPVGKAFRLKEDLQ